MAGETQLVSAAGIGDQSKFGIFKLVNIRFSISPLYGVEPPRISNSIFIRNSNITGGKLIVDLPMQSAWGFRLDFTEQLRPIVSAGIGDSLKLGTPTIQNTAFQVKPMGFHTELIGLRGVIADSSRVLFFDFVLISGLNKNLPLHLNWGQQRVLTGVGGRNSEQFGLSKVDQFLSLNPSGFESSTVSSNAFVANNLPGRKLEFIFIESSDAQLSLSLAFDPQKRPVMCSGSPFNAFGKPHIENTSDLIAVYGIGVPESNSYALVYNSKKQGGNLKFNFIQVKNQSGANVALSFYNAIRDVTPQSFDSSFFGNTKISKNQVIYPAGFQPSSFGWLNLKRNTAYITPSGFVDTHFSSAKIYNLKQILVLNGFYATLFGQPFLWGGVRYITVYGFESRASGATQVTNTRADQYAIAQGILGLSLGSPNVSPRHIRPIDISQPTFPQPLVQRSPYPLGLDHSSYGDATLWFRVRYLSPVGILGFDSGYAKIFDPTQFIYANPPQTSAVFGDIKAKNKNIIVYAEGVLASAVNEWAVFENTLRLINVKGIDGFSAEVANIRNKTPSIIPNGFASPVGEPSVADRVRRVNVVGIPYLFFGLPTLTTPPSLAPKGSDYLKFGDTFISLKTRTVFIGGTYRLSIGNATVWPWSRNVALDGIGAPVLTNDSTVTHGLRELLPNGSDSMKFSASHWLSFRIRTIVTESIVDNNPNTAHRVSRNIIIYPIGFDATEWGTRIIPESKTLLPIGIAPSTGTPAIDWLVRNLHPNGFATSFSAEKSTDIRFGAARTFNKTQYIVQFFDVASGLAPQDFSQWTAIEVRNKTISTYGVDAKKIGYALISNNAVQISPVGIKGNIGIPFVSYRVRSVFTDAIDSPYIANWNVIHNAAFVVAPISKNTDAFGVHHLFSNLQTLKINGAEMPSYGYHMVDFAVRTLQMESRYGIYPAYINLPDVQLHTRYIAPTGFEPSTLWASNVGMPDLAIHRNIISPKWTDRQYLWWGEPALKNLTPEIGAHGNINELFGVTSIRTQWENVFAKGDNSLSCGKVIIEFKTRKITVAGLNAAPISQLHKVIKLGAPPYSTQYIDLRVFYEVDGVLKEGDGYGIDAPNKQVSNPALNQSVIYSEGFMTAKFGEIRVTANTLKIEAGIYILGVANPSVGLKVRKLVVKGIDNYIDEDRIGKPRITPHTIYAPFGEDATSQARRNHPFVNSSYINTGVKFGHTMVVNKNRGLWHYGAHTGNVFGTPSLMLSRQYIQPTGMRSEKSGWHSIPFSLQTVTQLHDDDLDSFQQFGETTVARPPYLGSYTIKKLGESYQLFGETVLQNSIRFLCPVGLASIAMGGKLSGDNPFMWQGLRIGELVLGNYGGDEHAVLGLPFISAKVRDIGAEGFDSLLSEYDIYDFKARMRVYRQTTPTEKDYIQATATNAVEFGNARIAHGHYFIRPDGNSETYRQGIG